MREYAKIYCCGDCGFYDFKKHKCSRGAKEDTGRTFYRDCPLGLNEEKEETMPIDRIKYHKDLCERMHAMYVAKNADYGDSFQKVRSEYPNAICVRLSDKLNRIKALMKNDTQQVPDESIDDTLLDLANYALLELVERKADKGETEWNQSLKVNSNTEGILVL